MYGSRLGINDFATLLLGLGGKVGRGGWNPFHLLDARSFVDDNGLEVSKGLVDEVFQGVLGGKGNLRVARDDEALAGVDADALTVLHLDELERAKSLNLNEFVGSDILNDGVKELFEERFGILLRDIFLLCQRLGQLLEVYLSCHSLTSL